jgi:hypothetical protein
MIRDVYPGSGFFSFPDPRSGSRGQKSIGSATLLWIRSGRGIFLPEKNERPLHIPNFIIYLLQASTTHQQYKLISDVDTKIFSSVLSSLAWECLYLLHTQLWLGKLARNLLIAAYRINRKVVYSHSKTNIWRKT